MEWNVSDGVCVLQQICLQNINLWVSLCACFIVKDLGDKAAWVEALKRLSKYSYHLDKNREILLF